MQMQWASCKWSLKSKWVSKQADTLKDAVKASLIATPDVKKALTAAEIMAIQRAKTAKSAELIAHLVGQYITESVQGHLAFDIPASWGLFMLQGHRYAGLLNKVLQEGESGDGSEPDCLAQRCSEMVPSLATSNTQHAVAAAAVLQALVKQSDKNELDSRVNTLK